MQDCLKRPLYPDALSSLFGVLTMCDLSVNESPKSCLLCQGVEILTHGKSVGTSPEQENFPYRHATSVELEKVQLMLRRTLSHDAAKIVSSGTNHANVRHRADVIALSCSAKVANAIDSGAA